MESKGRLIQLARKKSGFTQQMLADRIGISRTAIYDWERGKYLPSGKNLAILESALGFREGSLFSAFYGDGESSSGGIQKGGDDDLKTLQRRFCDLIQTIGKLSKQCDTPEEVMRLLLDVGENGQINHPENEAFLDLLETLAPLIGEILRSIRRGERMAS